jgi:hypothetical protein
MWRTCSASSYSGDLRPRRSGGSRIGLSPHRWSGAGTSSRARNHATRGKGPGGTATRRCGVPGLCPARELRQWAAPAVGTMICLGPAQSLAALENAGLLVPRHQAAVLRPPPAAARPDWAGRAVPAALIWPGPGKLPMRGWSCPAPLAAVVASRAAVTVTVTVPVPDRIAAVGEGSRARLAPGLFRASSPRPWPQSGQVLLAGPYGCSCSPGAAHVRQCAKTASLTWPSCRWPMRSSVLTH